MPDTSKAVWLKLLLRSGKNPILPEGHVQASEQCFHYVEFGIWHLCIVLMWNLYVVVISSDCFLMKYLISCHFRHLQALSLNSWSR